jgi:hypothetical protein
MDAAPAVAAADATSRGDATGDQPQYRLLALEGESGCVFCRLHDPRSRSRLPQLSDKGVVECATRTLLRMANVTAVRQLDRRASMVGPGDYFCNVERPGHFCFTIELPTANMPPARRFPRWREHPLSAQVTRTAASCVGLRAVRPGTDSVVVDATWVSGRQFPREVARRAALYRERHGVEKALGDSLFDSPGLLEVSDPRDPARSVIEFPSAAVDDATALDLAPFRCRLVRNDQPFLLHNERNGEGGGVETDPKDDPRPVTYEYKPGYAKRCVGGGASEGGDSAAAGLFLEHHWGFRQTMTPLDPLCGGFIVVARFADGRNGLADYEEDGRRGPPIFRDADNDDGDATPRRPTIRRLEMLAVRVPFGWTIIIDPGCIHGDSTFRGLYMMAMTTNHVAMATADTVFVKHAATKRNVDFVCADSDAPLDLTTLHGGAPACCLMLPPPIGNGGGGGGGGGDGGGIGGGGRGGAPPVVFPAVASPPPIVVFRDASVDELARFDEATRGVNFVMQPFSKTSWSTTVFRRAGVYPGHSVRWKAVRSALRRTFCAAARAPAVRIIAAVVGCVAAYWILAQYLLPP